MAKSKRSMTPESSKPRRRAWLLQPEMLVALAAVLLGLCGLFVALYETSLMREEQRASVWPHAEVTASLRDDRVAILVQNTGIGPARVRDASLLYRGEPLASWHDLLRALGVADSATSQSMVGGQVLPAQSDREAIFSAEGAGPLVDSLRVAIVRGDVDVSLCYCSVYDECWTSSLRDMIRHWRGIAPVPDAETRRVERCEAGASAI